MATLNVKLNLDSTNISSNSLKVVASDILNVVNPIAGLSRKSIPTNAAVELLAAAIDVDTYIYIKNTDSTNKVNILTAAGGHHGVLRPGEAMFVCVAADVGIEVIALSAACVVEFATFTAV